MTRPGAVQSAALDHTTDMNHDSSQYLRRKWHLSDLRQWKEHDQYQAAFERLLRDLRA